MVLYQQHLNTVGGEIFLAVRKHQGRCVCTENFNNDMQLNISSYFDFNYTKKP